MTENQIQLIKATVPVLKEHGVALTKHFYQRMFTHNPELKHVFNMGNQQNNRQQTALALAVLAYAEHIEDPSVLLPVVDTIGHKHASLDIRPEHYAIVGKHLIASIGEVLGEAATPELLEAWTLAYGKLADLMSGHEKEIYQQRTQTKGGWSGWRPFIVKEKIQESSEVTSFYLYPADGGSVAAFKPGQYISLRLFLPELNLLQPRQYSISCAPNGVFYRISVKREQGAHHPDGMISNRLHQQVDQGDMVELSAPAGVFFLSDSDAPKVFISGGIGQTPLLAMLEDLLQREQDRLKPIVWVHGCRNEQVHAFRDRLRELRQVELSVKQYLFYDEVGQSELDFYPGQVNLEPIKEDVLQNGAEYYICGPAPFIKVHHQYLVEQGVANDRIHFEEFGPASLNLN
ncbi:MAG: NO-inducible flavohemoprotein [Sphingobacterium sp.]